MLPRIVLFVIQLAAAWYLEPTIKNALPSIVARPYDIFLDAILLALIICIVGLAGSLILKEVASPSGATLAASIVLALVFAGLTLVPQLTQATEGVVPALRTNRIIYPLVGAMLGYFLRR